MIEAIEEPDWCGVRRSARPIVCIASFAGADHTAYDVGLPWSGNWTADINTASAAYGGSDAGVGKTVIADDIAHQGCPASATLHLPALGTIWLTSEPPTPMPPSSKAPSSKDVPRP